MVGHPAPAPAQRFSAKSIILLVLAVIAIAVAAMYAGIQMGKDDGSNSAANNLQATPAAATATAAVITPTPADKAATESPTKAPTVVPTPVPATATPAAPKITSNFDLRAKKESFEHNGWKVQTYEGTTDQITNWFKNPVLKAPAPELWPTFPNVPNPLVPDFRTEECRLSLDTNAAPGAMCVPDGMYYGLDERGVFQNDVGDAVIQARGYLDVSGDFDWGFVSHKAADDKRGSALLVINVGNVSANFEDVHIDNGFSVEGRYFNGETLWWGIWGLTSHRTAAMLNYPVEIPNPDGEGRRILNAGDSPDDVNAGANCSVPEGCKGVHYTVVITSGNHVLLIATTTVDK